MAYAFMRAEGFVMVTGRPGTGKTTLIGDLVESLADENVIVANLVSTQLAADDLLRMVAFAFGLDANVGDKSTLLQQLTMRFLGLHHEGGRALLIVDEAQDLNASALEELRLLTNLQQDGKPLLQIFLLGQPELRELVHDPKMEQVHQRIVAASHLSTLGEDETRAYVEHRLQTVGWRNDPAISMAVFPIIYLFSEGVPRRINLICSRLFLHCCVEQLHQITVADAKTVVSELQEEQLSTRNLLSDELFFAEDEFELPLLEEELESLTSLRAVGAAARTQGQVDKPQPPLRVVSQSPPELPDNAVIFDTEIEIPDCGKAMEAAEGVAESDELPCSNSGPHTDTDTDGKKLWIIALFTLLAAALVAMMVGADRFL